MSSRPSSLARFFHALACAAALATLAPSAHAAAKTGAVTTAPAELPDNTCLRCHGSQADEIEVVVNDDETRTLRTYASDRMKKGMHGKLSCVSCHTDIKDAKAKHERAPGATKPNCAQCHADLLAKAKGEGKAGAELGRLENVVQNAQAYKDSFHARPDADHPERPKAYCEDCHDTHYFNVPADRESQQYVAWRQTIPETCGAKCHEDHLEDFTQSVHGVELLEKNNEKAATCADCHSTHAIIGTSQPAFKVGITEGCGTCHEQNLRSYRDTYHGQVNKLGYSYTARCSDCHGSHDILRVDNPESSVHPDNRLETCRECHDGKKLPEATAGFVSFAPHAHAGDREKFPQVWWVARFMGALLIGVFAYFWLHCLFWWHREYKHRRDQESEIRIHTEILKHEATDKHVRRFGPLWRLGHLCFAISVMTLILTGITVLYPHTSWAPVVAKLFGGPATMGLVHRIAATIMLSIFFMHLVGVVTNIARNWKTFRFFGPDSLVPRWQDFIDAWGMFKWFAGKGPRPIFDRWTYWEKFDYWAVFWGMGVIGSSGMMLAFPHITAQYLPGWVFNVATLVHGEEAFLAAVFLFTVHFFNNHFRPDKLPPPDVVMFTGTQSLEEFRREHAAQYQRLVENGQLEKYLVEAPSRPMTRSSKVLGVVLIGFGLTLLILVANGFFSAPH